MNNLNRIPTKCEIKNKSENETDIFLSGDIGESWWSDGITAKGVRQALSNVDTPIVNIHLYSFGGDAFEGVAICNALRQSEKTIHVYVSSMAASAGSMAIMGGDKIFLYENSQIMIHKPSTYLYGNSIDFQRGIEMLDKCESSYIATYMQRFIGTEEELKSLLEKEEFLTAQEAIQLGFADEIVSFDDKQGNTQTSANFKQNLLSKYANKSISSKLPTNTQQAKKEESNNDNFFKQFAKIGKIQEVK